MLFSLEAYFSNVCSMLEWEFLGIQETLLWNPEEEILTAKKTFLALNPNLYTGSRLFQYPEKFPTRLDNPYLTEGDLRYQQGTLLVTDKYVLEPDRDYILYPLIENESLQDLTNTLRSFNYQDSLRINLGEVVSSITSDRISHQMQFYIPLNNAFGA